MRGGRFPVPNPMKATREASIQRLATATVRGSAKNDRLSA
jgi:hypothetical protein